MWQLDPASKPTALAAFGVLFVLLSPLGARAATLRVAQGGGGQYQSIAPAIADAQDGDVILVEPGDYVGDLDLMGKELELRSTNGPQVTQILGEVTTLTFVRGESRQSIIDGFTLGGSPLRAMLIRDASPTLTDCIIGDQGSMGYHGTGAFIMGAGAAPLFDEVTFTGLLANRGGVYVSSGAQPTFLAPIFEDNQANHGGAIFAEGGAIVTLSGGRFLGNLGSQGGGGIYLSGASLVASDTLFQANAITSTSASYGGGHIRGEGACTLDLSGVTISGEGGPGTAAPIGAGIFLGEGCELSMVGGSIMGLAATTDGGAVALQGATAAFEGVVIEACRARQGRGGALFAEGSDVMVSGGAFVDNAAGDDGGGISGVGGVTQVDGALLCGNEAQRGGGLAQVGGSFGSANAIVRDNVALDGGGGFAFVGGEVELVNGSILGNSAAEGGGIYVDGGVVLERVSNAIIALQSGGGALFAEDDASASSMMASLSYSLLFDAQDGAVGGRMGELSTESGLLFEAPVFWSYAPGEPCDGALPYLHPSSPGVDGGDPSILDPDGSRSDVGAFGGPESEDRDLDGDGFSYASGDCDDGNPAYYPGADEWQTQGADDDCDGIVDEGTTAFDDDGDGFTELEGDCDDGDGAVYPGGEEVLNGGDDDCDTRVDEGTEAFDDDGDGYNEGEGDCDDANPAVNPGSAEAYNEIDDDCDGLVDEGTLGFDDDGDGWSEEEGDCNDQSPSHNPGAVEIANGGDDDCDGRVDEETAAFDDDGDGASEEDGDCDDGDPLTHPGAMEILNGHDDNCDGAIDEGLSPVDEDGDGVTISEGDCDDGHSGVFPGALEAANGVDDDCDGTVDEETEVFDDDGDGFSEDDGDCDDENETRSPGAQEGQNELDDDCDGVVDEGTAAFDDDGDGYSEDDGDCDDDDPARSPGAEDAPYDGVDADCDGEDPWDLDGDGVGGGAGGDCDDGDAQVYPGAEEVGGGVDDDCDGLVDEGVEDVIPACDDEDGCDDEPTSPPGNSVVGEPDVEFTGGCSCSSEAGGAGGGWSLLVFMGMALVGRRKRSLSEVGHKLS